MLKRLSLLKTVIVPAIAACTVIAVAIGAVQWRPLHHNLGALLHNPNEMIYSTLPGEERSIRLPDHSWVRLYSNTQIKVRPTPGRIDLELVSGRILCDVRHDSARIFHVSVAEGEIEDLGTQFEVARQGGEGVLAVIEGEVWFQGSADDRVWMKVTAGQKARVLDNGRVFGELDAGRYDDVAVDRKPHNFKRSTLADAATAINKTSRDLRIVVDGAARDRLIQGQFADAEEFLKFLRREGLDVTQRGHILVVTDK